MDDMMRQTISRNLLRHACGTAMFCPQCEAVLDATRAVLLTHPNGTVIRCTSCWGRGPFQMFREGWEVLDGRILFATPPRQRRSRRNRRAA